VEQWEISFHDRRIINILQCTLKGCDKKNYTQRNEIEAALADAVSRTGDRTVDCMASPGLVGWLSGKTD
jgi:hypothetical protein